MFELINANIDPAIGCDFGLRRTVKATPIEAGTRVRITEGPYADWTGLCEMSDGKRIRLLLHIMGGERPVKMAQSAVEVVR